MSSVIFGCNGIVTHRYSEIVICGDFNYNLFLVENTNVMNFLNCLSSYSLLPLITNATHITDHSCTLIDNIFITKSIESISGTIVSDITDHFPNFVILNGVFAKLMPDHSDTKLITYRVINDITLTKLHYRLQMFDLDSVICCDDVHVATEAFLTC